QPFAPLSRSTSMARDWLGISTEPVQCPRGPSCAQTDSAPAIPNTPIPIRVNAVLIPDVLPKYPRIVFLYDRSSFFVACQADEVGYGLLLLVARALAGLVHSHTPPGQKS